MHSLFLLFYSWRSIYSMLNLPLYFKEQIVHMDDVMWHVWVWNVSIYQCQALEVLVLKSNTFFLSLTRWTYCDGSFRFVATQGSSAAHYAVIRTNNFECTTLLWPLAEISDQQLRLLHTLQLSFHAWGAAMLTFSVNKGKGLY